MAGVNQYSEPCLCTTSLGKPHRNKKKRKKGPRYSAPLFCLSSGLSLPVPSRPNFFFTQPRPIVVQHSFHSPCRIGRPASPGSLGPWVTSTIRLPSGKAILRHKTPLLLSPFLTFPFISLVMLLWWHKLAPCFTADPQPHVASVRWKLNQRHLHRTISMGVEQISLCGVKWLVQCSCQRVMYISERDLTLRRESDVDRAKSFLLQGNAARERRRPRGSIRPSHFQARE